MKKRVLSVFIAFAMIVGVVPPNVGVHTTKASEGAITRAEWISELVELFEMTVEDDSDMPFDYFSDIEDSPHFYEIMLATEFGVIDLEPGQPFNPNNPTTREFAAQTMNFCLGFMPEELNEDTDVDYIIIAIEREWFNLIGGEFMSSREVTQEEKDFIFADAHSVLNSTEINPEYVNEFEFASNVVEIPSGTGVYVDENDTVAIHNSPKTIHNNDKFVVYIDDFPLAFTAQSVSVNGDVTTITTKELEIEDIVEKADAQGVIEVDLSQVEAIGDTEITFIEDIKPMQVSNTLMAASSGSVGLGGFSAKKTITLGTGKKIEVTATVTNMSVEYITNTAKGKENLYFALKGNAGLTGTASIDVVAAAGLPASVQLGKVPITVYGVPIGSVTISLEYSVSGTLTLTYGTNFELGVQYTAGGGFRTIRNFSGQRFNLVVEVQAKLGLKSTIEINLWGALKGSAFMEQGGKLRLQGKVWGDGKTPLVCDHRVAHYYMDVGVSASILWGLKSWKPPTIGVYREDNSPRWWIRHTEDGIVVPICTRNPKEFYGDPRRSRPSSDEYYIDSNGVLQPAWEFDVSDGKATITYYHGTATSVIIPSTVSRTERINGIYVVVSYPVTEIDWRAFNKNRTTLTSVVIPNSVTTINTQVFSGCTSLTSVTIPDSVIEIGSYAFKDCTSLTSVMIPDSVIEIGDNSFDGCSSLTSVRLSNSITEINWSMFRGCISLPSVTIPNSVTKINGRAFSGCSSLTSIDIPDSVTEIGDSAFRDCTSLTDMVIGSGLRNLGWSALGYQYWFDNCPIENLTINCPTNSLNYGNILFGSGSVFRNSKTLKKLTIGNNVKEISADTFRGCSALTSVTIPDSVTVIEYGAFADCTSLTSVTIPDSVTVIEGAFADCTSLTSVIIPDSVIEIGSSAFRGCTSLTNITIPDSVTTIGGSAFSGTSLTSITIPDSVTKIDSRVFSGCTSLKSVTIPDSVTTIGYYAFGDCTSLKSVTIPDSVTTIDYNAFSGCASLTDVIIGSGVTKINGNAFEKCPIENLTINMDNTFGVVINDQGHNTFEFRETLKKLIIGDNMKKINNNTFWGCESLTSVIIGNSVTEIGDSVFADCTSLTSVTIPDSVTTIDSYAFTLFGSPNLTIYCYKDSTAHKYAITNNIPFVLLDSDNPPVTTTPTTTTEPPSTTTISPNTTTSPTNTPPTTTTPSKTTTPPTSRKGVISKQGISADKPTIFCALEILKALIGMPSQATDNPAALITEASQKKGQPTIFDALEILKYLVGINGEH